MKNVFEEYNKKLIEIDEYISRHNEDYNLYNYKANILFSLEIYTEALKYYNKAIEYCNNFKDKNNLTINKGNCLLKLERYIEALECYNSIDKSNLNNHTHERLNISIGICFYIMGNNSEALKYFNLAVCINNNNYLNQSIGIFYQNQRKYKKAILNYNIAINKYIQNLSNDRNNDNFRKNIYYLYLRKAFCILQKRNYTRIKSYSHFTSIKLYNNIRVKKRFYYFKKGNYDITRIKNYNFSRKQIINIIIRLYNNAINLYHKNYEALCNKGNILYKIDKTKANICYNKAKKLINTILDNNNDYESTYKIFSKLNLIKTKIESNEYNEIINKIIREDFSMKINYDIKNKSFFNYTSINKNTIKLIKNHGLWLSHTNNFNDPVDPSIKLFNRNSGEYDYLLDSIKVACLTTDNKNTVMWGHYADKHRGICIEYDISPLLDKNKNDFLIRKINYDRTAMINENIELYDLNLLMDLFSIKSKEWEYENEYRILYYDRERRKNGLVIPLTIKSVYFGTETPEDDKELIRDITENIELYELKFDDKELFKLIPKE